MYICIIIHIYIFSFCILVVVKYFSFHATPFYYNGKCIVIYIPTFFPLFLLLEFKNYIEDFNYQPLTMIIFYNVMYLEKLPHNYKNRCVLMSAFIPLHFGPDLLKVCVYKNVCKLIAHAKKCTN